MKVKAEKSKTPVKEVKKPIISKIKAKPKSASKSVGKVKKVEEK